MDIDQKQLNQFSSRLIARLIGERREDGIWEGGLSSSALSTAVAVFALAKVDSNKHAKTVADGLDWLTASQNADGGWGDTVRSASNISTTLLCWSALTVGADTDKRRRTVQNAERWICNFAGGLEPDLLADAVYKAYGKDKSFSAPILTMCALAGRLGKDRPWRFVKPLPFELAALPHKFFSTLRLPVVSYALPALIAIGQVRYHHRKPLNPISLVLRGLLRPKTLSVLEHLQPANGGFLEATPLTAFVTMSLACSGKGDMKVVEKAVRFLCDSVRSDGSWPIDTNLATWVTTLSINALGPDALESELEAEQRKTICDYIIRSQYAEAHPYTQAAPGGWGWTNLPGAVPDADDTAGALIALHSLDRTNVEAAKNGIEWLLGLQNGDGGIPTFCRGWTNLPFDRSAPDLSAHAIGAFSCWLEELPEPLKNHTANSIERLTGYLRASQRDNGSWVPLWFGNQDAPGQENPVYGTARVLLGLSYLQNDLPIKTVARALKWLVGVQNEDGGWGGDSGVKSSVEETALAVDALAAISLADKAIAGDDEIGSAVARGTRKLMDYVQADAIGEPSPIGLYFARLWYFEKLYPLIFTTGAILKANKLLRQS